jgi:hypothetical protein
MVSEPDPVAVNVEDLSALIAEHRSHRQASARGPPERLGAHRNLLAIEGHPRCWEWKSPPCDA